MSRYTDPDSCSLRIGMSSMTIAGVQVGGLEEVWIGLGLDIENVTP